jgi:hypothetical protein
MQWLPTRPKTIYLSIYTAEDELSQVVIFLVLLHLRENSYDQHDYVLVRENFRRLSQKMAGTLSLSAVERKSREDGGQRNAAGIFCQGAKNLRQTE